MASVDQIIDTQTNFARAASTRGQAFLQSLYGLARESVPDANTNINATIQSPHEIVDVPIELEGPPSQTDRSGVNGSIQLGRGSGYNRNVPGSANVADISHGNNSSEGVNLDLVDQEISSLSGLSVNGEAKTSNVSVNISGVNVHDPESVANNLDEPEIEDIDYPGYSKIEPSLPEVELSDLSVNQDAQIGAQPLNIEGFSIGRISNIRPPIFNAGNISNNFDFLEKNYDSQLLDLCRSMLASDIEDGGTGINPLDEQALFSRQRDRSASIYLEGAEQIARFFAAKGHDIAPSAMSSEYAKARDQYQKSNSEASREIFLERSRLYVQARQFAATTGVQIETVLIDLHRSVMDRSLDFEKSLQQFAISIYDLKFKEFELELGLFSTEVENVLKTAQAKAVQIENDKVKLEAIRVADQQDRTQLLYLSEQNKAAEIASRIDVNKIQLQELMLQRDKILIDEQKVLIDLYGKQIDEEALKLSAYQANIDGKKLIIDNEKLKLESSRVNVEKQRLQVDSELRNNAIEIDKGRQDLERSKTELDKLQSAAQLKISSINAGIGQLNALIEKDKLDLSAQQASMDIRLKKAGIDVDIYAAESRSYDNAEQYKVAYDNAHKRAVSDRESTLMQAAINDVRAATDFNNTLIAIENIRQRYDEVYSNSLSKSDALKLEKDIARAKAEVENVKAKAELAAANVNAVSRGATVSGAEISGAMSSISASAIKNEDATA